MRIFAVLNSQSTSIKFKRSWLQYWKLYDVSFFPIFDLYGDIFISGVMNSCFAQKVYKRYTLSKTKGRDHFLLCFGYLCIFDNEWNVALIIFLLVRASEIAIRELMNIFIFLFLIVCKLNKFIFYVKSQLYKIANAFSFS